MRCTENYLGIEENDLLIYSALRIIVRIYTWSGYLAFLAEDKYL